MSRITPSIQKLHALLLGKKFPQSFADTAKSEITSILQKTALEILTQIDLSPHTRTTANSHVQPSRANHHSFKDPHEALLQRTIQIHQDALATLRKDLSLDDADTLSYHQNKLKQARIDLLKSQTVVMASDGPSPHSPSLHLGLPGPQPSRRHHTQSLWAPHFMTQERIMFSNPTPSEPRLSPAATMSDATPSSLTPLLHCVCILQSTTPPQVVAFES